MQMTDALLRDAIAKALKKAQRQGELPAFDIPEIPVERPKQAEMGDWATPVCMQLARLARMAPIKIAEAMVRRLPQLDFVGSVQVAPPRFVNFVLEEGWLRRQVEVVLAEGQRFGQVELGAAQRVQVEYVSANPTGPLHMGSARNAVLGDALANVLANAGYQVQREYYVNDAGRRMRAFQETLMARYRQALGQEAEVPEDGYHGPYMIELGAELAQRLGTALLELPLDEALLEIGRLGVEQVVNGARDDLAAMGIVYDRWFSEQTLYDEGQYEAIMSILRQGGHLDLHDGAVWFMATALGGQRTRWWCALMGRPVTLRRTSPTTTTSSSSAASTASSTYGAPITRGTCRACAT